MKKSVLFALSLFLLPAVFAEVLTNAEVARLFGSLRTISPGLTAGNTRAVSLDINLLRPVAESVEAGLRAIDYQKAMVVPNTPAAAAKLVELDKATQQFSTQVAQDAKGKPMEFTFFPVDLSEKEIGDAKISPDALAEVIRFLQPSAVKK